MRKSVACVLSAIGWACGGGVTQESSGPEFVLASAVLTLGDDESLGDRYLFGSVSSVAIGPGGRIYVADRSDSSVRVYSQNGSFVELLGGSGEGPGEFQTPMGLVFSAAGDLWVRDLNRIQQFVRSANGGLPDSAVHTQLLTGYPNTRPDRAAVRDSLYYYPSYFFPLTGGARYFYEVFGPSGVPDTFDIPVLQNIDRLRGTSYRVGRLDRRQRELVSSLALAPFEASPSWQLTSRGTLLVASGTDTVVRELTASHDLVRELELPLRREAVAPLPRTDSVQALEARLAMLAVPVDDVENVSPYIRRGEIPDSLPTVRRIYEAADGRIWLEVWPRTPDGTDFLAISPDGTPSPWVRLPTPIAPVPPYFRDNRIAAVVVDAETGIERVVVFAFDP